MQIEKLQNQQYFKFVLSIISSVDATLVNCLGKYANDAWKNPNAKVQKVVIAGTPHLMIVARMDINPGEEIRYDYGKRDAPWRKKVNCVLNFK